MMADYAAAAGHFTLACDALAAGAPSAVLADGLAGRSTALRNLGRLAEATEDAHRALAMANELGHPAGQAFALIQLGILGNYQGEYRASLAWLRQAQRVDPARVPGWLVWQGNTVLAMVLTADGQMAAAERMSVDGLAQARQAGDLYDQALWLELLAHLDQRAGRILELGARIREALEFATRTGDRLRLIARLDLCGRLCAATERPAEAITLWAALGFYDSAAVMAASTSALRAANSAACSCSMRSAMSSSSRISASRSLSAAPSTPRSV